MDQEQHFRRLPVKLTEEDRLARAKDAAAKSAEYRELEADKKAATRDYSDRMKTLRVEWDALSDSVRTGIEHQPVEIVERRNEERGLIETVRVDTYEVIESRAMTVTERQVEMFGADTDEPASRPRVRREDA